MQRNFGLETADQILLEPSSRSFSMDLTSDKRIMLSIIKETHRNCDICPDLRKYRKCDVFSSGPITAQVCFIGEATGNTENNPEINKEESPFIGDCGKLFDKWIGEIGLSRKEVYVTNAVKDHPPQNKLNNRQWIKNCRQYLSDEIALGNFNVIVVLGRTALQSLTKFKHNNIAISRKRKFAIQHPSGYRIPVIVTYHPAGVMRDPDLLVSFMQDIESIKQYIG